MSMTGLQETAGGDMALKLDAPFPAPLAPDDRLAAVDILRGTALFGVMAINVVFEFRVSIFEQFLSPDPTQPPLDRDIQSFLEQAISLKAFALFSLLFGIGIAIQFDRLATKPRAILLLRRLLALLAFGLIHLTLIWDGDILTEYALAGLLVLPLLYGSRWLLAGSVLILLAVFANSYLSRLVPLHDANWLARHVLEARRVYATGSFAEILAFACTKSLRSHLCTSGCFPARCRSSCSARWSGGCRSCSALRSIDGPCSALRSWRSY
jgi:uncharacterized protein